MNVDYPRLLPLKPPRCRIRVTHSVLGWEVTRDCGGELDVSLAPLLSPFGLVLPTKDLAHSMKRLLKLIEQSSPHACWIQWRTHK